MPFDGETFNKFKTKATTAKLSSLSNNMRRLIRDKAPLRGFALKGKSNPIMAVQGFERLVSQLFEFIEQTSDLRDEQREHFLTGEKFQSTQKGPCGPVTQASIQQNALDPIIYSTPMILDADVENLLDKYAERISSYCGNYTRIDIRKINFEDEWRKLDKTRMRGFPYHASGTDCDEEIIRAGGCSLESALNYFKLYSQLVCFPGGRIQGKPYPGPAKVRIIMIPCVFYQYLMNGIVTHFMDSMKRIPSFAGGNDPHTLNAIVLEMQIVAERDGYVLLTLDFEKFDKLFAEYFRKTVGTKILGPLIVDCPEKVSFLEHFQKYVSQEYQFLGTFEKVDGRDGGVGPMPNQLASGIKNTQEDGSLGNIMGQSFASEDAFGDPLRLDLTLVLGDDAVMPVKKTGLTELGYEGVMKKLAASFKKIGFSVNASKRYPNTDTCFLQKLYSPKVDIKGAGTGARSLASFLGKEKYQKKIPGIKSYAALEIVAQISILSNVYALQGVDLRGFSQTVVDAGIEADDGLRGLLQNFNSNNGHEFFRYVVKASGADLDQILDYMDAVSYDHTGLSSKLQSDNYELVFPILTYIMKSSAIQNPVRIDPAKLFDESGVVTDLDDNEDFLDED